MTSVPERPDVEAIDEALTQIYTVIFGKGLKIPADMIKHLTHDEWKLAVSTYFSRGARRTELGRQLQSVLEQIARDRMTEPEIRRAADYTVQHWTTTPEVEASTDRTQPAPKRRTRRPSPSRLAKWEAHWQAEQAAEGDQ